MIETFGQKLAQLLAKQNITQAELARRAGIGKDRPTYYIKNGGTPRPRTLKKIADALHVAPSDLVPERYHATLRTDDGGYQITPGQSKGMMRLLVDRELPSLVATEICHMIAKWDQENSRKIGTQG